MVRKLHLVALFTFTVILATSAPLQSAFSETGFTNVKKATGVIMKFCSNHAMTLSECDEKYDGYTWTDRINVLIWAPGWNTDSEKMERIGEAFGSPITISTRDSSVDTAVFAETGPDTGVFFGVVKLTGQQFTVHDQNGWVITGHGHISSNYVTPGAACGSGGHGASHTTGHTADHGSDSGHGTDHTADHGSEHSGDETDHGTGHGSDSGHGHGFLIPLIMQMKGLLFSATMTEIIPSAYAQHAHHGAAGDSCETVTGSAFDVAARVTTDLQKGAVTVSWEANEDTHITKTATWTWRTGELSFEKDMYTANEPIKFTLHDRDLWIHHADFFNYWMRVFSDTDKGGIFVPVAFVPNHDHGPEIEYAGVSVSLSEPAASSLTKYTPDGKWKLYFWWQPGGVIGVDQDYELNMMAHDGKTDIHQTKLSYDMEIWYNGQLLEARNNKFSGDGHAIEPVRFDERGSVKIVFKNIFGTDTEQDFSFQVAPEAVIEELVPRHHAFDTPLDEFEGRYGAHYIDVLEGEFYVTFDDESSKLDRLRVSDGDTITVEYIDMTLPKPYTSRETLDVRAKTTIFDIPSQLTNIEGADETSTITEVSTTKSYEGIKKLQGMDTTPVIPVSDDVDIPDWIKKNAAWWSKGQINDPDFAKGIEYLVQENIIDVPLPERDLDEERAQITSIPMWVRNNAAWWAEGHVSDIEFVNGLKFLIHSGLIKV